MPSSSLPVELCKMIIDDLQDDRTALLACGLTCKTFLHISRYHLFHDISLNTLPDANHFVHSVCSTISPINTWRYVRRLSIGMLERSNRRSPWGAVLPEMATHLLHVTTLEIGSLRLTNLEDAARCKTPAEASEFIASFPILTDFFCPLLSYRRKRAPVIPLPSSLKSITLPHSYSRAYNQLLSVEPRPALHTANFKFTEWGPEKEMGKMLEMLGSSLEYLSLGELSFMLGGHGRVVFDDIDLAHNTHLRFISLQYALAGGSALHPEDWLFAFLSQITSPHMDHICLEFLMGSVVDVKGVNWASIDLFFAQQRWANLEKLSLRLVLWRQEEGIEAAFEFIKTHLPTLTGRGTVHLSKRSWRRFQD